MKEENFIVGNWYKSEYDNYFKFLKFEDGYFYSSEEIVNNEWSEIGLGHASRGFFIENKVNISEIAHLLPDNHPDLQLINNIKINENMDYLIPILNKIYYKFNNQFNYCK